jgi:hypothetical protein
LEKGFEYSNTTLSSKFQLKFYNNKREMITAETPLIHYKLALSKNNLGINNYISVNSKRFYNDYYGTQALNIDYKNLITQPFLIDNQGNILRNYTQLNRIRDMHQFIEIKSTLGGVEIPGNQIKYENGYLLIDSKSGADLDTKYVFVEPLYQNQSNHYWWNQTQIYDNVDNYNRATFCVFIILFIVYMIAIPLLMILFHLMKKNNQGSNDLNQIPNKVGTGFMSQYYNNHHKENDENVINIYTPHKVGAAFDEDDKKNKLARDDQTNNVAVYQHSNRLNENLNTQQDNTSNLSFCGRFCFNMKNGLYSGLLRKEALYSPRYKDLTHLWFFQYFSMFILTLLFVFTDLDTAKPITDNWHMYLWYVAISFGCSNVLCLIVYFVYSSSTQTKSELTTDDVVTKDSFKKSKCNSLIKSIILLLLCLALFGFLFYGMLGFVMVFEKYDHVFIVTFILQMIVDFFIFEFLFSMFFACWSGT